jgi:type VI secretion system protein ImpG
MNPELLKYYSREMRYLREMGGEFAAAFPKIAGRLGLDGFECADPYVERLLEGFSFMAARVQMKLDAAFPRFTQHLAEMVYPQFLAPTPSMAVVQFVPEWTHPGLPRGIAVPRQTALYSLLGREGSTRCEYRTAHETVLWPLRLVDARYEPYGGSAAGAPRTWPAPPKAMLRLRFEIGGGTPAGELAVDRLPVYLRGGDAFPVRLYEELTAHVMGGAVASAASPAGWQASLDPACVSALGFGDEEALLPASRRTFQGYRLLHEYFAFPQRYLFVEIRGLREPLRNRTDTAFEIELLLDRYDPVLAQAVDASYFALYCTPAINLFPYSGDRIALAEGKFEHHVVVDRTRPIDFEVYAVESVRGYRTGDTTARTFLPFYLSQDPAIAQEAGGAYFQMRREPRLRSHRERRQGARSRYLGSEVHIALVDERDAPYADDLRQLGLDLLCTNRDLPLSMPIGVGRTDFTFDTDVPVESARCVAGPSEPRPILADGPAAWRFLSHLSLNMLSLSDGGPDQCARVLREQLALYAGPEDDAARRQIEALRAAAPRSIVRRLPGAGPIGFGRGIEMVLTFDKAAFEGSGAFLLGAVLHAFFTCYVSINHFVETAIRTAPDIDVVRWPAREGTCPIL